jgi:hypothetical protein
MTRPCLKKEKKLQATIVLDQVPADQAKNMEPLTLKSHITI